MIDITAFMAVRRTVCFTVIRHGMAGVQLDKFEYEGDESQDLSSQQFELIVVYGPTIVSLLKDSQSWTGRLLARELQLHVRNARRQGATWSSINKGFMTLCDIVLKANRRQL